MPEPFDTEKGVDPPKPPLPGWKRRSNKFFEQSTFNGALYMFASTSWTKRILWMVVVLAAIGGFWYVTITHIIRLVREPISTSITLTRENKLPFPAVTVCSLSILNTTKLRSAGNNDDNGESVIDNLVDFFAEAEGNNIPGCQSIASNLVSDTGFDVNWGELTQLARNDRSALISSCTFAGEDCTNDFTPVNTVAGVCYTFNGPSTQPTRTVRGTGIRQGLTLNLSPGDQLFSQTDDHGFRIVIHNPDEPPIPEAEGIAVALSTTTYIGMRQVTSIDRTRFSSGFQCRGENDPNIAQNLSFPGYSSYSPSLCQSECFYRYVADTCGCIEDDRLYTTAVNSPYNRFRMCKLSDVCCEVQAFREVEDSCDCPPKCETVQRTTTISSSTSDDGFVHVNVYYETLILETRETSDSYTVWSLISDIGGNTGLFLGFTLLSGVELLVLVVGLIKDCCCGGCKA